jgi:CRISPR-associated protein Cas1
MSTLCEEIAQVQDVPELIPARMLNEFAYCPRLAYLEWVQGEFADNLDVLEGRFGHRRVDEPSRADVPAPAAEDYKLQIEPEASPGQSEIPNPKSDIPNSPPEPPSPEQIHTRSLMLSAPSEGLIAKMDLVDIQAGVAVPVDYKHGRVPDLPAGAWEPEQVQLCAQGLILRENGYLCEGGILYYVDSRKRVSIQFDDKLVDRTRELLRELRETAARRAIPPPLADSPKCPRCSLVGICLPDETRLLAGLRSADLDALIPGPSSERRGEESVRRLMPARDDALPLYIKDQGATLGKSGDELTVKSRKEMLQRVKLIDTSQVSVFGNVQVTAQALGELAAAGIPLCHFSYGGWFRAMTVGMVHKNVELRIAQFAAAADPGRSLALARQFTLGKIRNCRTLLRRHLEEDQGREVLGQLAALLRKAESAADAASLLGIEGMAAKEYFAGFARLLKGGEEFNIEGRNRRPPRDPVNALLSFVYALLVKEWTLSLHAVGFDPLLGFYHRPRYGRPSLALDLAEEFRPLLADSTVLTLVNNGEVTPGSFLRRAGAVALTDAGRRAVLAAFERRMDTLVTHPLFGYRISYRRILEVQARLLGRVLLGEIAEYPSFCTR